MSLSLADRPSSLRVAHRIAADESFNYFNEQAKFRKAPNLLLAVVF